MSVDTIGLNKISQQIDLGPTQSLQLLFAKLQLALAEQCKTQAVNHMDAITESQDKSKEVAAMIQTCRELQSQAKNKEGGGFLNKETGETITHEQYLDKKYELELKYAREAMVSPDLRTRLSGPFDASKRAKAEMTALYSPMAQDQTPIPPEIKKFMEDHSLALDKANDGRFFDKDGWEVNITSLRNYQEQLGADTQQKMIYIQDFMGQYNSYLQGANSAIQQSNQTLTTIARGQ